MGYNALNLGNQPNDNQGDGGRTGGEKINSMFREVYEHTFATGRWFITRYKQDVANEDVVSFRVDDKVSGWADDTTKVRWVEGIIKTIPINLPADIDTNKFFIISQRTETN
ncbi:MAG: hypothetical protein GY940_24240 [bacterium]|nr:hypothetical protein [bacterium]